MKELKNILIALFVLTFSVPIIIITLLTKKKDGNNTKVY